jgi:hypothetical protein
MTEEGAPAGASSDAPAAGKAGWYRDRNTGQRRFWNGSAWTDLASAITASTVAPPLPNGPRPPPAAEVEADDKRIKRIALAASAALVVLVALIAVLVSHNPTENVSTSATFETLPRSAFAPGTTPVRTPTTTSNPLATLATAPPTTALASSGGPSPAIASAGRPTNNVAIVGDSIFALAEGEIARYLHQYNLYVDAVGRTTMAEHLSKIQSVVNDGQPRDWVIELGTNDALPEPANPNWASDFANEVAALQTQPCVVFVTVNPRLGPISTGIDQAIAGAVAAHPNFHSLDWGNIEFHRSKWLESDQLHPTESGAVELAKLTHKAILNCQGK